MDEKEFKSEGICRKICQWRNEIREISDVTYKAKLQMFKSSKKWQFHWKKDEDGVCGGIFDGKSG